LATIGTANCSSSMALAVDSVEIANDLSQQRFAILSRFVRPPAIVVGGKATRA